MSYNNLSLFSFPGAGPFVEWERMQIVDLGNMRWREAYAIQQQAHEKVLRGGEETIFVVEHPHVITLGRQTEVSLRNVRYPKEELAAAGIDVEESDRGGNVTYHGPGQVVCYPIVRLAEHRLTVGKYVRTLQDAVVDCLGRCMVKGVIDSQELHLLIMYGHGVILYISS